MFVRLLLDPASPAGAGATTAPAPAPAPAAEPAPEKPPEMVPLTTEEYQRLRLAERQLAEVRAEDARRATEAEAARLKLMADKGQAEQALAEQRTAFEQRLSESTTKYADLERQYLAEKKAVVIADALAGAKFVSPDAAMQARLLLEARFVAARGADGTITVRDEKGLAADAVIREAIGSPAFAHFLEPGSRGGAPPGNTHRATPTPAAPAGETPEQRFTRQLADQVRGGRSSAPGLAGTYSN